MQSWLCVEQRPLLLCRGVCGALINQRSNQISGWSNCNHSVFVCDSQLHTLVIPMWVTFPFRRWSFYQICTWFWEQIWKWLKSDLRFHFIFHIPFNSQIRFGSYWSIVLTQLLTHSHLWICPKTSASVAQDQKSEATVAEPPSIHPWSSSTSNMFVRALISRTALLIWCGKRAVFSTDNCDYRRSTLRPFYVEFTHMMGSGAGSGVGGL